MIDLAHTFGGDLSLSPSGDLALSSGTQAGQERVLRRLLTNPGDYLWHLGYGAGLPAQIGQPADAAKLRGLTLTQMLQESVVASNPAPVVTVNVRDDGTVTERIKYADANTGDTATLTVPGA